MFSVFRLVFVCFLSVFRLDGGEGGWRGDFSRNGGSYPGTFLNNSFPNLSFNLDIDGFVSFSMNDNLLTKGVLC